QVDPIMRQTTPFDFALVHDAEHPARAEYSEAFAYYHRGVADVIEGGNANRTVEGIVLKRKVFGHPKQKRKPVLVRALEEQRIDPDEGLTICKEPLIEAEPETKSEDSPLGPDKRKEPLFEFGPLSLLFPKIPTVKSIEQSQFPPP